MQIATTALKFASMSALPGAGIAMSFDDLKVIEAARFLRSVAEGKPYGATIEDAVASATALDAVVESVATGSWVGVRQ